MVRARRHRHDKGAGLGDKGAGRGDSSATPPPVRNTANERERDRMRVLSRAFAALKTTLPWVPVDTKLSKLDTLRLASAYIAHLAKVLADGGTPGSAMSALGDDLSSNVTNNTWTSYGFDPSQPSSSNIVNGCSPTNIGGGSSGGGRGRGGGGGSRGGGSRGGIAAGGTTKEFNGDGINNGLTLHYGSVYSNVECPYGEAPPIQHREAPPLQHREAPPLQHRLAQHSNPATTLHPYAQYQQNISMQSVAGIVSIQQ